MIQGFTMEAERNGYNLTTYTPSGLTTLQAMNSENNNPMNPFRL